MLDMMMEVMTLVREVLRGVLLALKIIRERKGNEISMQRKKKINKTVS